MQLKYAFSFAAVIAFLAACDSTVTNINDDAKGEGTITIKVVDNHSGAALSGVSVYSCHCRFPGPFCVEGSGLGRP